MLLRVPIGGSASLFYPLLYGLNVASFGALIWRAARARAGDRRRLLLFAIGITAGSTPLVIQVLLESFPSYYAFTHSPGVEPIVGGIVFGAFAVIPFVTAYSVLFDRIVDLRVVLRAALQYALARYTNLIDWRLPCGAPSEDLPRARAPVVALMNGEQLAGTSVRWRRWRCSRCAAVIGCWRCSIGATSARPTTRASCSIA